MLPAPLPLRPFYDGVKSTPGHLSGEEATVVMQGGSIYVWWSAALHILVAIDSTAGPPHTTPPTPGAQAQEGNRQFALWLWLSSQFSVAVPGRSSPVVGPGLAGASDAGMPDSAAAMSMRSVDSSRNSRP